MAKKGINWNLVLIIITGLILGGFYWFEYRPVKIKKQCQPEAIARAQLSYKTLTEIQQTGREYAEQGFFYDADYLRFFNDCLIKRGLKF